MATSKLIFPISHRGKAVLKSFRMAEAPTLGIGWRIWSATRGLGGLPVGMAGDFFPGKKRIYIVYNPWLSVKAAEMCQGEVKLSGLSLAPGGFLFLSLMTTGIGSLISLAFNSASLENLISYKITAIAKCREVSTREENVFEVYTMYATCSLQSSSVQFNSVAQSLNRVRLFVTPWIPAHQASLSITNSQS